MRKDYSPERSRKVHDGSIVVRRYGPVRAHDLRGVANVAFWLSEEYDWYFPSEADAPRLHRLLPRKHRLVGPATMLREWRVVTKGQRRYVMLALGVCGALARVLNVSEQRQSILGWYKAASWPGLLAQLVLAQVPHHVLMDAVMLGHWRFVPDHCNHTGHWYLRHTVGRRPEACPLHAKAARQARYRRSPASVRRRAKSGIGLI